MGMEYKIKFTVPANYDPSLFAKKLPSPIDLPSMAEIYSYSLEQDGFYFVDHLVNRPIASMALRIVIDEALSHAAHIEVFEPGEPPRQLFAEDRLDAWFDGSAVCVVASGTHCGPLDLGEAEVRALIVKLQHCLAQSQAADQ